MIRLNIKSIPRTKSVIIFTLLPILNILATLDNIFDQNQACLTTTSYSHYEEANIYLSICKDKNI